MMSFPSVRNRYCAFGLELGLVLGLTEIRLRSNKCSWSG